MSSHLKFHIDNDTAEFSNLTYIYYIRWYFHYITFSKTIQ